MWWEGGVMLPHHHHNVEHSINHMVVVCIPMNNTFSLCPKVSDTACCLSIVLLVVSSLVLRPNPSLIMRERELIIVVFLV